MRPLPLRPEAMRPSAGPAIHAPRATRIFKFSCVARWLNMPTSMAGAISKGHLAASAVMVSRLSAIPCASFASVLAVQGAMTSKSAL